jgi:hypothetical protein
MMDEDWHMSYVGSDNANLQWYLVTPDSPGERVEKISTARWDEYRGLLEKAGVLGIGRSNKSSDVSIDVHSAGILPYSIHIEYVHCGNPDHGYAATEPPCVERQESGSGIVEGRDPYRYKRLSGDWYLYEWRFYD